MAYGMDMDNWKPIGKQQAGAGKERLHAFTYVLF